MTTPCERSPVEAASAPLSVVQQTQFKNDGYLTISRLAPEHDLHAIRSIIDGLYEMTGRNSGVVDHALHLAPQLRMSETFRACERIAKQLLGPAAAVSFDQAIFKPPHEMIGTRWHQDQAFQGKYRPMNTLHFWIPLQSVTELNGCLHFIPGSHQLGLLPHYQCRLDDPFSLTPEYLPAVDAVSCPLNLGDATCHLPLTLHRAQPNATDSVRRAWALLFRLYGKWGALSPVPLLGRCMKR